MGNYSLTGIRKTCLGQVEPVLLLIIAAWMRIPLWCLPLYTAGLFPETIFLGGFRLGNKGKVDFYPAVIGVLLAAAVFPTGAFDIPRLDRDACFISAI
jgi:hypothetical protein